MKDTSSGVVLQEESLDELTRMVGIYEFRKVGKRDDTPSKDWVPSPWKKEKYY